MVAAAARMALDPVADLRRRLIRCSGARQRRGRVRRWWADHGLAEHPAAVGKRIAIALVEQRSGEAKLAGVLVLGELLADQLRYADLAAFGALFEAGHLADTAIADRFARGVLAVMLERAPNAGDVARGIAGWHAAELALQRRAACLAFVDRAAAGQSIELILELCDHVVWSPEACDQIGVGRLLGALARAAPDRATAFFRRHARFMSRACAHRAVSALPATQRRELLALHRRATRF